MGGTVMGLWVALWWAYGWMSWLPLGKGEIID